MLAAKDLPDELFTHLAKQIESIVFYYIITRTSTKELERRFSKWANDMRNVVAADNQHTALNDFIQNNLIAECGNLSGSYDMFFKGLTLYSLQRYKLKYLLGRITQYVDMQRLGQTTAENLGPYLKKEIHIEHILPDTPTEELVEIFSTKEDFQEKQQEYNRYKIKLGNLTLLERPLNIIAGRNFFLDKKPFYKKCKYYLTKSIAEKDNVGKNNTITKINEKLDSFDEWNSTAIDGHQIMLYNLSKEIWRIEMLEGKA